MQANEPTPIRSSEYQEKRKVKVIIQTGTQAIIGHIYLPPRARFKDSISSLGERFIAVTDSLTTDWTPGHMLPAGLTLVKVEDIVWITPLEDDLPTNPTKEDVYHKADKINTRPAKVLVQTTKQSVEGEVHLPIMAKRIKDVINNSGDRFLVVTGARVEGLPENAPTSYLVMIKVDRISWIKALDAN